MSSKKPKIPVDDYYLSIHYGISMRADELVDFRIDEKPVPDIANITSNTSINVSSKNFWGGDQKRGGIEGVAHILMGGEDQLLPASAAGRLPYNGGFLTPETAPGYRGMTSVFLHGSTLQGWKWGSNSPSIPKVDARVRRASPVLPSSPYATRESADGYRHSNAAHIIYECMTSVDFGAGIPASQIDTASFLYAAEQCHEDGLYLSTMWTRETNIEDFIRDVLAHITGVLFINLDTGLFTLKLFRDDYDVEEVPVWGPDKVRSEEFSRKGRGEIVTRINLIYTNPETGDDETVTAVDEASSAMQDGAVIPSSIERRMVRDPELAARLADKELRSGAAPLASGRLKVLRDANGDGSSIKAGQVFYLEYPDLIGDHRILCRVSLVDYGKTNDRYITVTWKEDIFSLPVTRTRGGHGTMWVDPSVSPEDLQYKSVFTVPYPLTFLVSEAGVSEASYPDVYFGLLGFRPETDVSGFQIYTSETDSLGGTDTVTVGVGTLSQTGVTTAPLVAQASTSSLVVNGAFTRQITAGEFILLGDPAQDETCEWCHITGTPDYDSVPGSVVLAVDRGVYDTIPRAHPSNTRVWFLGENYDGFDTSLRPAFAETEYKLLTITSRGVLDPDDATPVTIEPTDRPHAPFRPANLKVGGVAFGRVEYETDPATVPVTWANRDRTSEDSIPLAWDDSSVPLEDGATVTIEIVDTEGDVVYSQTGLTGTSHALDIANFGPNAFYRVRAVSVRDSVRSIQNHSIEVYFAGRAGYGSSYGVSYGV